MHWNIQRHDWIDSTNDEVARLARSGAPEGTVVVAEGQRQGRGRLGSGWESPHGKNLYCSILLRPPMTPAEAQQITLVTAIAVAEAIESVCHGRRNTDDGRRVCIKWPNDILIGGKKLGGILTEASVRDGELEHVIVGIGINVAMEAADFSAEIRDVSTSLALEGVVVAQGALLESMLTKLAHYYPRFYAEGFEPSRPLYEMRALPAAPRR